MWTLNSKHATSFNMQYTSFKYSKYLQQRVLWARSIQTLEGASVERSHLFKLSLALPPTDVARSNECMRQLPKWKTVKETTSSTEVTNYVLDDEGRLFSNKFRYFNSIGNQKLEFSIIQFSNYIYVHLIQEHCKCHTMKESYLLSIIIRIFYKTMLKYSHMHYIGQFLAYSIMHIQMLFNISVTLMHFAFWLKVELFMLITQLGNNFKQKLLRIMQIKEKNRPVHCNYTSLYTQTNNTLYTPVVYSAYVSHHLEITFEGRFLSDLPSVLFFFWE